MPLHTTEAFVLRTYSLGEADKICVFLTKDLGKVRGVAHGARKLKSRFGSSLEPFTEVTLTYFFREGRELMSVSTCEIVRSHFLSAGRDVETAGAFSYMAELLTEFLPDHEPNERLYRLLSASLEAIGREKDLYRLLRYFESWLLRLGGFFPDTARCASCGEQVGSDESAYLTAEGAPRCAGCSGSRGTEVSPALRIVIREMFRTPPAAFAETPVQEQVLSQIADINYQIIRNALERDLKSRALLKQLSVG